jgi:hypothetical protein
MMIDRELLKRALANVETQMNAVMQILGNGRQLNGNSFDYNNLMTTKKHIEDLLAVPEVKKESKK